MTLVQKIDTMLVGPAGLPRETLRASGSLYRPKPLSSGATMSYSPEAFCFGGRYAETIDQTSNSSPARLADVARRRKGADCSSLPRHDADRGRAGDDFGRNRACQIRGGVWCNGDRDSTAAARWARVWKIRRVHLAGLESTDSAFRLCRKHFCRARTYLSAEMIFRQFRWQKKSPIVEGFDRCMLIDEQLSHRAINNSRCHPMNFASR